MQLSDADIHRIKAQFDYFCKKVLRNHARNLKRKNLRQSRKEIVFSGLPDETVIGAIHIDRIICLGGNLFDDLTYPISIEKDALAQALRTLSQRNRQIILLTYFEDLTDQQIGKQLNAVRSTVQAARSRALKEMREMLEKKE